MNNPKTPQLRFAGFKCEWKPYLLADNCSFTRGQGYSKNDILSEGAPIFLYGRLYTDYSFITEAVDTFAKLNDISFLSTGKEVVMPSSGETAEDISKASAIITPGILLTGGLNVIYPNKNFRTPFFALSMTYGDAHDELASKAQGKSIVHLYNSDIATVYLYAPNIQEQRKIGEYFRELDRVIGANEREVRKLEQMKSACLQKMFPRPGHSTPQLRFKGFDQPWKEVKLGEICKYQSSNLRALDAKDKGKFALYDANNQIGYTDGLGIDEPYVSIIKDGAGVGRLRILPSMSIPIGTLGCLIPKEEIPVYFLLLVTKTLNLGVSYSGSTIPHIYFSDYKKYEIQIPCKAEQEAIASFFRNLDELIVAKTKYIVKLKNIKAACLRKMFVNNQD